MLVGSRASSGVRDDCSGDGVPVGSVEDVAGSRKSEKLRAGDLVGEGFAVWEREHR